MVISPVMLVVVLVAYVAIQVQVEPSYAAWNPDFVSCWLQPADLVYHSGM